MKDMELKPEQFLLQRPVCALRSCSWLAPSKNVHLCFDTQNHLYEKTTLDWDFEQKRPEAWFLSSMNPKEQGEETTGYGSSER